MATTNVTRCECCGQTIRQPKALTQTMTEPDKSQMSDAELIAYCKRTAIRDDARFSCGSDSISTHRSARRPRTC